VTADVDVEPLIFGIKPGTAEMPFAGEVRLVAVVAQNLRECDFLEREMFEIRRGKEGFVARPMLFNVFGLRRAKPVRCAEAGGVASGEDAGAGGAADGAGGVGLGEADALGGEAIEVGRVVKRAAVAAEVPPAEVVREDEDDVRAVLGQGQRGEQGGCGDDECDDAGRPGYGLLRGVSGDILVRVGAAINEFACG